MSAFTDKFIHRYNRRPIQTMLLRPQKSFNYEKYKNSMKLSKKVWDLKEKGQDFKISWKIIDRTQPYRRGSKYCNLCVTEKYHILMNKSKNLLNSRSELVSKCRHTNKFMLSSCKVTMRNNPNG